MDGIRAIFRKELEDHFSGTRFTILLTLILMISLVVAFMTGSTLRKELEGLPKPSLVFLMLFTTTGLLLSLTQFIALFGPLIGMVLGFDAINRERALRTLSKLVAQPIYRDAIINGKFLAGLATITVLLVALIVMISGMGLWVLGVVPGWEEVGRLGLYLIVSLVYIAFWLGLAILFSTAFRSMATSALATLAVWIFLAFFVDMGAQLAANALAPLPSDPTTDLEAVVRHAQIQKYVSYLSPIALYSDATRVVLDPLRSTTRSLLLIGPMERLSLSRFQSPLPFSESMLIVAPHLVSLLALTVLCFAVCYVAFLRQEVRST